LGKGRKTVFIPEEHSGGEGIWSQRMKKVDLESSSTISDVGKLLTRGKNLEAH